MTRPLRSGLATWALRWMKKIHEVKKSLLHGTIYGIMLWLQISCYLTLVIENYCQFWQNFSNTTVCILVQITNAWARQPEVILLSHLLRLLCITLYMQFVHLVHMGLGSMLIISRIISFLLHTLLLRHKWRFWTMIKMLTTATYSMLQQELIIIPLVRAALFVARYLVQQLILCVYVGMMACEVHIQNRFIMFTGNLTYGGRGPSVFRTTRMTTHKIFDATMGLFDATKGYPGEG